MTDGSGEKLQIIMLIIRINRVFSGFFNQLEYDDIKGEKRK